jgi:predicted dithiol-disulfide oxidoreductase (DUF899 family)
MQVDAPHRFHIPAAARVVLDELLCHDRERHEPHTLSGRTDAEPSHRRDATSSTGPSGSLRALSWRRGEMIEHRIGTREEWQAARDELLRLEKEHTRMGDDLARRRRELPWVPVEKGYRFDTGDGTRTLVELFDGRSQLLVYHFMFGPSYEAGCPTCSSSADAVNAVLPHLHARDVTMLYVSRAPIDRLLAYEDRMGWTFPWVSCGNNDFNFDLGFSYTDEQVREFAGPMLEGDAPAGVEANAAASGTDIPGYLTEGPGFSTFAHDDGVAYHTYSTQARGLEFLMGYYPILDRAPKGRDEGEGQEPWLRRHDEY